MLGKRVYCFDPSLHSGQYGTVLKNYDSMLILEAEDQTYAKSWKSKMFSSRVFQVDALLCKEVKPKDTKD